VRCVDSSSTHLVTVSPQVVKDIAASFSHVHLAPVYHLLVNVEALLRKKQSGPDASVTFCERRRRCLRGKQQNRIYEGYLHHGDHLWLVFDQLSKDASIPSSQYQHLFSSIILLSIACDCPGVG